jgi:hypothetical protein
MLAEMCTFINILILLLAGILIGLWQTTFRKDESYFTPYINCWTNCRTVNQTFNLSKDACQPNENLTPIKEKQLIERIFVAFFFIVIIQFGLLECINTITKIIKRKITNLIKECIENKEEVIELTGIVNVQPMFNSNYEIQFVTIIASIATAIIKIFSQYDVFFTPIEIFMLIITGSLQILLFLKNLGNLGIKIIKIWCKCCSSCINECCSS